MGKKIHDDSNKTNYQNLLKLEEKMARVNKRGVWNEEEVRKKANYKEAETFLKKLWKWIEKFL